MCMEKQIVLTTLSRNKLTTKTGVKSLLLGYECYLLSDWIRSWLKKDGF